MLKNDQIDKEKARDYQMYVSLAQNEGAFSFEGLSKIIDPFTLDVTDSQN